MTIRTTKRAVTFTGPFTLKGVDERLPAGVYFVETDEEPLENISFLAYRRLSTVMHVPGEPGDRVVARMLMIDPIELNAALERDRARVTAPAGRNYHLKMLKPEMTSRVEVSDRQAIERGENEGMKVHSR